MVRKAVTVKFAGIDRYIPSTVLSISVEKYRRTSGCVYSGFLSVCSAGHLWHRSRRDIDCGEACELHNNGNPFTRGYHIRSGLTRLHRLKPYRKTTIIKLIQNIKILYVINVKRRKRGEFERGKGVFFAGFFAFPLSISNSLRK